ncbi:MAG TPA: D-amino-acid transaminase [Bacillales bacterium]|nr:D-amino-acid transaminase [Bacillales bacterium]
MILFQNQFVKREEAVVDIEDRGYQFGDGIYEVIRVYNGQFFGLEGHLERLVRSTAEIRMELPMSVDELEQKLKELVKENGLGDGFVYLQITRGAAPRTHHFPEAPKGVLTAYTKEMPRPLDQMKNGIQTVLAEDVRWLRCDIKSLNLLANVMAKQEAKDRGCAEAIFHRGDTVTEGSSSNLLIVNNGELWTHPANNLILNGITRKKVFELAESLGLKVNEQEFTVEELLRADEAFITSTTAEVTPVVQVDDTVIGNGKPGKITDKLREAFEASITDESYAETN